MDRTVPRIAILVFTGRLLLGRTESVDARQLMTFSFRNVIDTSATLFLPWAETRESVDRAVNLPDFLRSGAEDAVATTDDWHIQLHHVGSVPKTTCSPDTDGRGQR